MSIISQRSRDCTPCKLISGCGLIGMGCYVAYYSQKYQGISRLTMLGVTSGLILLGAARLLDLPPFPLDSPKKSEIR